MSFSFEEDIIIMDYIYSYRKHVMAESATRFLDDPKLQSILSLAWMVTVVVVAFALLVI